MNRLRSNVLSNLGGQTAVALLSLLVVPWYIRYMGVESYALVGIYASLQAMFAVLDMGLSQTLGREIAINSASPQASGRLLDTARTLEIVYVLGAGLVFVCIAASADYLAYNWLKPVNLAPATVAQALWSIGLVVALRWPLTLYTGGLYGLQRQFQLNVLLVGFTMLQTLGALGVLILVSPTVKAFFTWQATVAIVQVLVTRWALWHGLPKGRGRFTLEAIRNTWKFAAGMTAISLLSTVLTQIDKVVLSRFISLQDFGYYALASTAAAVIYKLSTPIFNAFLPRLTQQHSRGEVDGMRSTYHLGCQLLALLIVPCALVLAVYAEPILSLWIRDHATVQQVCLLFTLIVIGNAFNCMMVMPYSLQLAHGWTQLSIAQNAISALVFVPLVLAGVHLHGALGAATAWILLNLLCMIAGLWWMHRRILPNEQLAWYRESLAMPLAAGGLAMFGAYFLPVPGQGWSAWPVGAAALFSLAAVFLSLPMLRTYLTGPGARA